MLTTDRTTPLLLSANRGKPGPYCKTTFDITALYFKNTLAYGCRDGLVRCCVGSAFREPSHVDRTVGRPWPLFRFRRAMSVSAHFRVPAEQFPLGDALSVGDEVHIRLESVVPTADAVVPYLWVSSEVPTRVIDAFRNSEYVESARLVDEVGSETLVRVHWASDPDGLIGLISDSDAVLLEGEGRGEYWSFRLRFTEHRHLSSFYQACVDHGFSPAVDGVNDPLGSGYDDRFSLTAAQQEALLAALESGYYEVPRRITLEGLATELGISDTALSQRLRRGLTRVLTSTLGHESGWCPSDADGTGL